MKKLLLVLAAVILVIGGMAVPASAQNEGVVTVEVQPATISVTVGPSFISYGVVDMDTENCTPVEPSPDPRIMASNNGNCWISMDIRGGNTEDWALASTRGPDQYVHKFGIGPEGGLTYTPLTTLNQDMNPFVSMSPGSNQSFKLQMDTPASSTSFGLQTTTVTVVVTMEEEGIKLFLDADGPYASGTANAALTANVTDATQTPVTGITTLSVGVAGLPIPFPLQQVPCVEIAPGIYTAEMDITALGPGTYTATAVATSSGRRAQGYDDFTINP